MDEEILYELFLNAGPLERVNIPRDRETKKQKNFAFIVFQHVESTEYAFNLLNGTELFRQPIRLQNKDTGLGMGRGGSSGGMGPPSGFEDGRGRDRGHMRSDSAPVGGVQFGGQQQGQQGGYPYGQQPPVWGGGGYGAQYHQYQTPYGYGNQGMNGYNNYNSMGGDNNYNNRGGDNNFNNRGGDRDRSYSRDRDNRGQWRDERRDHSRDSRDSRDRSYDRSRQSRR